MKFPTLLGCALATVTAVHALDIPLPEALQMVYGLPECSVSLLLYTHSEYMSTGG